MKPYIVKAKFQTIRPLNTYSINVMDNAGREAWGVRTENMGHLDWQLFDNVADAKMYADIVVQCETCEV